MYNRNFKTIILIAMLMMFGSVVKAQDLHLKAQVPFDFKLGELTMPVGEYHLIRLTSNNGGVFRIKGENALALKNMMPTYNRKTMEQSLLVFNKYEGPGGEVSYFLTKIWVKGDTTGFYTSKSPAEKAAAARAARRDVITLVVERVSRATE